MVNLHILFLNLLNSFVGVHGDVNETYLIGNVAEEHKHLVQTTYECLNLAIESVSTALLIHMAGLTVS